MLTNEYKPWAYIRRFTVWYIQGHIFFLIGLDNLPFVACCYFLREIVWHTFWQKWSLWQPRHTQKLLLYCCCANSCNSFVKQPFPPNFGSMFYTSISDLNIKPGQPTFNLSLHLQDDLYYNQFPANAPVHKVNVSWSIVIHNLILGSYHRTIVGQIPYQNSFPYV